MAKTSIKWGLYDFKVDIFDVKVDKIDVRFFLKPIKLW